MDNVFNLLHDGSEYKTIRRIRDTVGTLPTFPNTTSRLQRAMNRGKCQPGRCYEQKGKGTNSRRDQPKSKIPVRAKSRIPIRPKQPIPIRTRSLTLV